MPTPRLSPLAWLRAALVGAFVAANTLVHAGPIVGMALLKAALPIRGVRAAFSRWMPALGESWIWLNSRAIERLLPTRWVVSGAPALARDRRYLVLSNHQSWVDIPVLQKVLNRRIPFQRFFLKQQLFWVPVIGLAWWALDFPFMKRATKSQIAKDPSLGQRDREAARRACAKFRDIPVSVMNFVEGTRATAAKLAASPYRHLLAPKSGGVAQVIQSMGEVLDGVLDVTVVYPDGRPTLVEFLAGKVREIRVDLRLLPVPADLVAGDYDANREDRLAVQRWINGVWAEKDAAIDAQLAAR
jgi:1-acyl-sn-glycerol-3-phosphate acyltransferase